MDLDKIREERDKMEHGLQVAMNKLIEKFTLKTGCPIVSIKIDVSSIPSVNNGIKAQKIHLIENVSIGLGEI